MTAHQIVRELILRLGRSCTSRVIVSALATEGWPRGLLAQLTKAKFLRKAEPAHSVICPGCHHACPMKVFSDTHPETGNTRHLIVCDRRDDIGYVPLNSTDLEQWQLSVEQLADLLKAELQLTPTAMQMDVGTKPLGRIRGEHGPRLVAINTDDGLHVAIGNKTLPLIELIFWQGGSLVIDIAEIKTLADRDETATHESYVPSTKGRETRKAKTADRRLYWKQEYLRLKRGHPEWSDQAIAATIREHDPHPEKRDPETIRRYMK
jgi:hypothetical protein